MKIVWSPQARGDLRDLVSYLVADNPAAAQALRTRLQEQATALADHPALGRPGRVPGTRELIIPGTPYLIPYRVRDQRLEILRVYHGARRWPERFD
ncbi:MAG: type II toxin-antitoxin system RelE/ParE family toxin [Candidatus Contendobacter sp.]